MNPEAEAVIAAARAARARLILANLRLVSYCAKQHALTTCIPFEDMVQEGILGLLRAVEKYDPERGFRFSTYATWWIQQFIMRSIADRGRVIRIPVHIADKLRRLRKKTRRLTNRIGRPPTADQLAREIGCDIAEVNFLLSVETEVRSLDGSNDPDTQRTHIRSSGRNESPVKLVEHAELKDAIEKVLNSLTPRSRKVLILRFGLLGNKPRTLEQVGRRIGVSRERVRQIEKKALEQIAGTYRGEVLRPFAHQPTDDHERT
jgi:RNA polymerase primary sigma factor